MNGKLKTKKTKYLLLSNYLNYVFIFNIQSAYKQQKNVFLFYSIYKHFKLRQSK